MFESSFVFSEDPADEVEEVYLKGITLIAKYSGKERITIAVETAIGVETIKDKLKKLHINLSDYNVNQAVIYLKFKGEGRKGSVTMRLSYPDRDNLNDSHYHQKAKVYVNKWGLLNESRGA